MRRREVVPVVLDEVRPECRLTWVIGGQSGARRGRKRTDASREPCPLRLRQRNRPTASAHCPISLNPHLELRQAKWYPDLGYAGPSGWCESCVLRRDIAKQESISIDVVMWAERVLAV